MRVYAMFEHRLFCKQSMQCGQFHLPEAIAQTPPAGYWRLMHFATAVFVRKKGRRRW